MELGKNIKNLRAQHNYSQEDLAELVYVTRQTISKWETDKNYPDLNSLILLSKAFNITIDNLIKGDLEIMKQMIEEKDVRGLRRGYVIAGIGLIGGIVTLFITQMVFYSQSTPWIISITLGLALSIIGAIFVFKCGIIEKKYDIGSFKEIIAFSRGETLDEIAKAQEKAKRPYQSTLILIITIIIAVISNILLWTFSPNLPPWSGLLR